MWLSPRRQQAAAFQTSKAQPFLTSDFSKVHGYFNSVCWSWWCDRRIHPCANLCDIRQILEERIPTRCLHQSVAPPPRHGKLSEVSIIDFKTPQLLNQSEGLVFTITGVHPSRGYSVFAIPVPLFCPKLTFFRDCYDGSV